MRGKKRVKGASAHRVYENLALCVLSALCFFLMVHASWYFLAWVCLSPILFVLMRGVRDATPSWQLVLYTVFTGLLIAFFSYYWLALYRIPFYVLFVSIVAVFAAVIACGYLLLSRLSFRPLLRVWYLSLIWGVLMGVFSLFWFGNMWMKFAYLQPMMYPLGYLLQPFFYTVFIIFVNALVAEYAFTRDRRFLVVLIVCVLLIVSSSVYSYTIVPTHGEEVTVALVQGYVKHSWFWRQQIPDEVLSKYETLTREVKGHDVDIIIWPEYAIPADFRINTSLHDRVSALAQEMDAYIVVGVFHYVNVSRFGFQDDKYDSFLVYAPSGELVYRYDATTIISVNGDVLPGTEEQGVIVLPPFSFTAGLCFEEYVDSGSLTVDGGDFVMILSNNNIFGDTRGLSYVSQFSKLKALEKRQYVVRVANTGYTQIVSPYGKVIGELPTDRSDVLIGKIYI